ncbi:hypothetical protein MYAM1_000748 [Malassezia yamatoensis]|uniref:Branched-chain-amino-acid aminotransferase-like protein 2 n=1 Tax=Malassezia yamatoensis TaxID=253288 RepID=A0AAJ5YQT4_9BASI|nr:hypothetical protein MYAM1_000748 [Malassezia yamatoensis]
MTATASTKPIIVWCHPRSCSTAFERAFLQRKDTQIFHEPLGDPFYFGKTRACHRYSEEECKKSSGYDKTIESVALSLLESAKQPREEECRFIFIKDMAQYIFSPEALHELHPESKLFPTGGAYTAPKPGDNPTALPTALLQRFQHTFLIRTPEKSVPSYYKCTQEKAAGFDFFDPAEAGYKELELLYNWIADPKSTFHQPAEENERYAEFPKQEQAMPPPLVGASVLLSNPGATLQQYCEALGVPFTEDMLSWNPGAVDIWAKWGKYHESAEGSSGFIQEKPKEETPKPQPDEVQRCIDDNMPTFDALYEKRTITLSK